MKSTPNVIIGTVRKPILGDTEIFFYKALPLITILNAFASFRKEIGTEKKRKKRSLHRYLPQYREWGGEGNWFKTDAEKKKKRKFDKGKL